MVTLSSVTVGKQKLIQVFIWQQWIACNFSFIIFTYATVIKSGENMEVVSDKKQAFDEDFWGRIKKRKMHF